MQLLETLKKKPQLIGTSSNTKRKYCKLCVSSHIEVLLFSFTCLLASCFEDRVSNFSENRDVSRSVEDLKFSELVYHSRLALMITAHDSLC